MICLSTNPPTDLLTNPLISLFAGLSDPVASDDAVVPERSLHKEPAGWGAESESLMQTGAKASSSDDTETPCMVIAGIRHGSRSPTSGHEWRNQAAWPRSRSRFVAQSRSCLQPVPAQKTGSPQIHMRLTVSRM